jgi:hypothetical protein
MVTRCNGEINEQTITSKDRSDIKAASTKWSFKYWLNMQASHGPKSYKLPNGIKAKNFSNFLYRDISATRAIENLAYHTSLNLPFFHHGRIQGSPPTTNISSEEPQRNRQLVSFTRYQY